MRPGPCPEQPQPYRGDEYIHTWDRANLSTRMGVKQRVPGVRRWMNSFWLQEKAGCGEEGSSVSSGKKKCFYVENYGKQMLSRPSNYFRNSWNCLVSHLHPSNPRVHCHPFNWQSNFVFLVRQRSGDSERCAPECTEDTVHAPNALFCWFAMAASFTKNRCHIPPREVPSLGCVLRAWSIRSPRRIFLSLPTLSVELTWRACRAWVWEEKWREMPESNRSLRMLRQEVVQLDEDIPGK